MTFGTIVTRELIAVAVRDHVALWATTYLAEMERRTGRDAMTLPEYRSYVTGASVDRDEEDQLPGCVVAVPGVAAVSDRGGDGSYTADWLVHVASVVSAVDRTSTEELAGLYTAAVRALILQHPSIGGLADESRWVDERYDEMAFVDERTLSIGVVSFELTIPNVVSAFDGPVTVPADPYADPLPSATVETVFVTTGKLD